MTYWSLRALGNSAFPIAFSQEPLQPVIARKLNGIYAIALPSKLLKYCFERGNSQFFRVPYPLVTSEKSLVGHSMRAFFSNRGRPRGISAAW